MRTYAPLPTPYAGYLLIGHYRVSLGCLVGVKFPALVTFTFDPNQFGFRLHGLAGLLVLCHNFMHHLLYKWYSRVTACLHGHDLCVRDVDHLYQYGYYRANIVTSVPIVAMVSTISDNPIFNTT